MQFQVPQFIEREARVVGPLTFRQFLYVGAAGAVAFVMYFTLPFTLFIVGTILVVGIGASLAFFSMSGRSLPSLIIGFLSFTMGTKTYVWKKGRASNIISGPSQEVPMPDLTAEQLSLTRESKLKSLSSKLDGR
ncbi:MAG: PrgI family protein [bacterium]|nr:PrgI family protein [bacterium]